MRKFKIAFTHDHIPTVEDKGLDLIERVFASDAHIDYQINDLDGWFTLEFNSDVTNVDDKVSVAEDILALIVEDVKAEEIIPVKPSVTVTFGDGSSLIWDVSEDEAHEAQQTLMILLGLQNRVYSSDNA